MSIYGWSVEWARSARIRTIAHLVTTSTNSEAKEQLDFLGNRSLVIADHQTSGRGRGENSWEDSGGNALLSSWVFQSESPQQPITAALVGLALYTAAKSTWPQISWALRAPNDLHVIDSNGRTNKIAGLLIEVVSGTSKEIQTSTIVGLGFNITSAPTGTRPFAATSLVDELTKIGEVITEETWRQFLQLWLTEVEAALLAGRVPELKQSARSTLLAALAQHPEYRDIEDIRADGSLVFKDGRVVLWSSL